MAQRNLHVVIIGGGFGGVYAAKCLAKRKIPVTLFDRNNYHLFQPLLYQVAAGYLGPASIAAPLRTIFSARRSVTVLQDEVTEVVPERNLIRFRGGELSYDYCIVATGVTNSYFGNDDWAEAAPGLKTVEDAIEIRARVLSAYERAEHAASPEERDRLLRFVIVGGGPTGVELAGALGELAKRTLPGEFRRIDPSRSEILLVEAGPRLLESFHEKSSKYAAQQLEKLGVKVRAGTFVRAIREHELEVESGGVKSRIEAGTILWAAGVQGTPLARSLTSRRAELLDRRGRVKVSSSLNHPDHPNLFVIGDLAAIVQPDGSEVPGVAPAAMQQGRYVAQAILLRETGGTPEPFRYFDKGSMAVIGRGRAVAESCRLRLRGFPAWLTWAFVHIYFLIEFENKLIVFFQWAWNYLTDRRGSRLITHESAGTQTH